MSYLTVIAGDKFVPIKPRKLESLLTRAGVEVATKRAGSGHKVAKHGNRKADIPFHGGGYEISDRLLDKILAQLGMTRANIGL